LPGVLASHKKKAIYLCSYANGWLSNKMRKPNMPKQKSRVTEGSPAGAGALKIKAAAKYLGGISPLTLRRQIDAGNIKPCRTLRHLLIPVAELDRWLAEGQK
jgi:excisionase family DNA binding protein